MPPQRMQNTDDPRALRSAVPARFRMPGDDVRPMAPEDLHDLVRLTGELSRTLTERVDRLEQAVAQHDAVPAELKRVPGRVAPAEVYKLRKSALETARRFVRGQLPAIQRDQNWPLDMELRFAQFLMGDVLDSDFR